MATALTAEFNDDNDVIRTAVRPCSPMRREQKRAMSTVICRRSRRIRSSAAAVTSIRPRGTERLLIGERRPKGGLSA